MLIRPAYPDELGRAHSLLNGQTPPPGTSFLVVIKEQPVERIVAAIPWWKVDDTADFKFNIHSGNSAALSEELLEELFTTLESLALEEKASTLTAEFPLVEEHPLFQKLTACGYEISRTETIISAPGEEVKSFFLAQENELPADWSIESIRGRAPETFYPLVAAEGSFTPMTFKAFWDGANRERFEENLSHFILAGEEVIGLLLITLRGTSLNIQVESISPDHLEQAGLISTSLHQVAFQNCPEDFPEIITWNRQTQSAYQGGQDHKPRHTLSLRIVEST